MSKAAFMTTCPIEATSQAEACFAAVPTEMHADLAEFVTSVSSPTSFSSSGAWAADARMGKLLDLIRAVRDAVGVTGRLPILQIIVWATSNFVSLMAAVTAQDWVGVFTILATLWPIIFPEPV